jgi:peptidase M28-like protein
MTATPAPATRRRPRRGSLERPVDGRLYRSAFLVVLLPLVILAFSSTRPATLPAPVLPPNFDGPSTRATAVDFAQSFPSRTPGSARALAAADWVRDRLAPYGLKMGRDVWEQNVPGLGRVKLQNVWGSAAGQSSDAIVVMAHRDDTGEGPGANDNATGTAALIELARSYAQSTPGESQGGARVRPAHTIVFLSTDGDAFGNLGAKRFATHLPFHVVATVNLDAIARTLPPRLVINSDTPRSPAAALVETAAHRLVEQTGSTPRHASPFAQLLDLAFPLTFYGQGPLIAHGIPAVTLTTSGERPQPAFTDRPGGINGTKLAAMGRAAQQLLGSLDQGVELTQGTTSFVWGGGRIVRGWAIELLLASLLIPFFVAAIDLFANCRRRRIALGPALGALRSRLFFWAFLGLAFYGLGRLGAWPEGVGSAPPLSSPEADNWRVLPLLLLAALALLGWLIGRQRLVPRRPVAPEDVLAGETVALLALGIVALLVLATNPFTLVFVLPALHAWLWLPSMRSARAPAKALVFLLGLTGPIVLVLALAHRYGLGFDAPWYLLDLAASGVIAFPLVAMTLAGGACGAQLAAAAAGRYAPYPRRGERPARGPVRETVRAVVLTVRARRRSAEPQRRYGPP